MEFDDYPLPHGDLSNIPARAPRRGGKVRYPWTTMVPGQWFLFPHGFKFDSARIMAAQNAAAFGYHLRVFRTRSDDPLLNDRLCCQRLDGLPEHVRDPEPERDQWGTRLLPSPTGGEVETAPDMSEQPVLQSGVPEYQQMGYDSEEEYRKARGMK